MAEKEKWDRKLDEFEYFLRTKDAIIGIYEEGDDFLKGWIVSSKSDTVKELNFSIPKDKVVSEIHSGKVEVIENVPEWFYSKRGFDKVENG